MRYLVVFQQVGEKFAAYVPDIPTCAATGDSADQVRARIRDALRISMRDLRKLPTPTAYTEGVEIGDGFEYLSWSQD